MNFTGGFPQNPQIPQTPPRLAVTREVIISEVEQAIWILQEWHKRLAPGKNPDPKTGQPHQGFPGLDYDKQDAPAFAEAVLRMSSEMGIAGRSLCHLAELLEQGV